MTDPQAPASDKTLLRRVIDEVLDLLAPSRCCGCGEFCREMLCPECAEELETIDGPYCPDCGHPHPPTAKAWPVCAECARPRRQRLDGARSIGLHVGPLRRAVVEFKFEGRRDLAEPLGELMARRFDNEFARSHRLPFDELDAIVPVVLHPKRLRWRGFDQALVLSRELARRCDKPLWDDVLARVRNTAPQLKLSAEQRADNMRGAFEARKIYKLQGASVLIVDDVYTTGVTLREAAKSLKQGGAARVYAMTITRAAPEWHPKSFPTLLDQQ